MIVEINSYDNNNHTNNNSNRKKKGFVLRLAKYIKVYTMTNVYFCDIFKEYFQTVFLPCTQTLFALLKRCFFAFENGNTLSKFQFQPKLDINVAI